MFSASFSCSWTVLGVLGWFRVFRVFLDISCQFWGFLAGFGFSWQVLGVPGQYWLFLGVLGWFLVPLASFSCSPLVFGVSQLVLGFLGWLLVFTVGFGWFCVN